jgi:hypothetical protein
LTSRFAGRGWEKIFSIFCRCLLIVGLLGKRCRNGSKKMLRGPSIRGSEGPVEDLTCKDHHFFVVVFENGVDFPTGMQKVVGGGEAFDIAVARQRGTHAEGGGFAPGDAAVFFERFDAPSVRRGAVGGGSRSGDEKGDEGFFNERAPFSVN